MEKVCVLMSTYNGEKYLREQLDSILNQRDVDVCILARDDGSKDSTVSILNEYSKTKNVTYLEDGKNLGACKSFLELLWNVSLDYDYYAFSDQDDYWLDDKLSRGIGFLKNIKNRVKVYSSTYTLVNQCLEPIESTQKRKLICSFGNSIIENQVTGCTVIMSRAFVEKVRAYPRPVNQYIHDWWIYKAAQLLGTLVIDEESRILYRQHGNNTIGISGNPFSRILRVLSNGSKMQKAIKAQDEEFIRIYDLPSDKAELIEIAHKKRGLFSLLLNKEIQRANRLETIIYKLWMLTW